MDTRNVRRRGRADDLEELMIEDVRETDADYTDAMLSDACDMKPSRSTDSFHWDIWLLMTVQNWVFDFGRPIAALMFPAEWFPMHLPSVGDYFHMLYNLVTPFCILKLFERSHTKTSSTFRNLCVIIFVMGASIHLVGDSINHRLVNLGYKLHLSVRDNPMMQSLQPRGLVDSFVLLYNYDEVIGHLMWYIPFFICLFLYYAGCFLGYGSVERQSQSISWWILTIFSGVYYWYLVTEGQIFVVYFITFIAMLGYMIFKKTKQNSRLDANGLFLLYSFALCFVLVIIWVMYLWNDEALRLKYPGLLYIPEPWSYYTLYIRK
uniref:Ceroid-lipofuscinosis neuronal protein 6 homolog isoform X1 n=1 Tax=Crassostrea virginica TaxID=6565 RepID=A0A8B8E103_CRAVI|nr:ceroid-lipofuscinosis neuronal protein 6 homolog isoform X1 [Crassostrea virginica]